MIVAAAVIVSNIHSSARSAALLLLLAGQALLIGLGASAAFTLNRSAALLRGELSAETAATLAGLLAQQKAQATALGYAGWTVFLLGFGWVIYESLRRRLQWSASAFLLIVLGHLIVLGGLWVLPIVLFSAPPFDVSNSMSWSGTSLRESVIAWSEELLRTRTISVVVATAGWAVNAVACGLVWRASRESCSPKLRAT